jgi:hypothetical protein
MTEERRRGDDRGERSRTLSREAVSSEEGSRSRAISSAPRDDVERKDWAPSPQRVTVRTGRGAA